MPMKNNKIKYTTIIIIMFLSLNCFAQKESWDKYVEDTIPVIGDVSGEHIIVSRDFFVNQDSIYLNKKNIKITFFSLRAGRLNEDFESNNGTFTAQMKTLMKVNKFNFYFFEQIEAKTSNGEMIKIKSMIVSVYD